MNFEIKTDAFNSFDMVHLQWNVCDLDICWQCTVPCAYKAYVRINEIPNNPGFLQIKTAAYTANQTLIYHRGMNNVSEKMGFNV